MTALKSLITTVLLLSTNLISTGTYQQQAVNFTPQLPEISILEYVKYGGGKISKFDNIMKSAAAEHGLDWRLLAAIGYQESKFNCNAISHMGALGLMQVMPHVAAGFGVSADSVMIPEVNIVTAVKLIKNIQSSIQFAPNATVEYKTKVILACYNAGIGNVYDARRLAAKCGADYNNWEVMESYLELKCAPEYANDETVKYGKFAYRETIDFVEIVMKQYDKYCKIYPA